MKQEMWQIGIQSGLDCIQEIIVQSGDIAEAARMLSVANPTLKVRICVNNITRRIYENGKVTMDCTQLPKFCNTQSKEHSWKDIKAFPLHNF